jgi:hypothetical protein
MMMRFHVIAMSEATKQSSHKDAEIAAALGILLARFARAGLLRFARNDALPEYVHR